MQRKPLTVRTHYAVNFTSGRGAKARGLWDGSVTLSLETNCSGCMAEAEAPSHTDIVYSMSLSREAQVRAREMYRIGLSTSFQ